MDATYSSETSTEQAPPLEIAGEATTEGIEGIEAPDALERLQITLENGVAEILKEFREKLTYDRFKEEQVTRLHEELQTYRSDLVSRTARQLLLGLIRLHDDLGKTAVSLRQKPAEELSPERFLRQFGDFQDDIELLLGQHGVERFESPGEIFDPRRQTALRTISTDDLEQVGKVAEHLRPGFETVDALLQKERVAVFVASSTPTDHGTQGEVL